MNADMRVDVISKTLNSDGSTTVSFDLTVVKQNITVEYYGDAGPGSPSNDGVSGTLGAAAIGARGLRLGERRRYCDRFRPAIGARGLKLGERRR
jgi:hypothetical protein